MRNSLPGMVLFFLLIMNIPAQCQIVFEFTGSGNFSKTINWKNGLKAPPYLLNGYEILINPTIGECILDTTTTIMPGGKLTIAPGKVFRILKNVQVLNANGTGINAISSNERKVLNWFNNLQLPNGLLESSDNSNFVSLYDNALSAFVFMSYNDFTRAEKIFDFFNGRLNSEFLIGNRGFYQFRDKYGNPFGNIGTGDNAWLLLALNNYKALTGSIKYNALNAAMEAWVRSLQDADGGIWGGFDGNNVRTGKVTEGNIDAFAAVPGYDNFHFKLLSFLKNQRWNTTDKLLVSWPDNPPYYYALDNHCWAYCAMEDFPVAALTKADMYLNTKIATVIAAPVTGYCFDKDKDDVWLEGTGEMVVAFQTAGLNGQADFYLTELEKVIVTKSAVLNTAGIPYASNRATGYGNGLLWVGSDTNPAISSGAWYLFGKHRFDPFKSAKNKNIPASDKFYTF
ncbi:hypothetical protein BH10BAC3_BH10BAC3_39110 [soil metagenome]